MPGEGPVREVVVTDDEQFAAALSASQGDLSNPLIRLMLSALAAGLIAILSITTPAVIHHQHHLHPHWWLVTAIYSGSFVALMVILAVWVHLTSVRFVRLPTPRQESQRSTTPPPVGRAG